MDFEVSTTCKQGYRVPNHALLVSANKYTDQEIVDILWYPVLGDGHWCSALNVSLGMWTWSGNFSILRLSCQEVLLVSSNDSPLSPVQTFPDDISWWVFNSNSIQVFKEEIQGYGNTRNTDSGFWIIDGLTHLRTCLVIDIQYPGHNNTREIKHLWQGRFLIHYLIQQFLYVIVTLLSFLHWRLTGDHFWTNNILNVSPHVFHSYAGYFDLLNNLVVHIVYYACSI